MKYKPGDKLNVMQKSCCGKALFDHDATLVKEVKGDEFMPIWTVRLEDGTEVNRYLYPQEEIDEAMAKEMA